MRIGSKTIRVLAMIGIGAVLSVTSVLLGCSQHLSAVLTDSVLFFVWPLLGGKW